MATIGVDKNGRKRILFIGADRRRHTIRLGKVDKRTAEAVKVKLEQLVAARLTATPPSDEAARWSAQLDDRLYKKLAAMDLLPARDTSQVGPWLEKFIADRGALKPRSVLKLRQTIHWLNKSFPAAKPLRRITPAEASDWRTSMVNAGLSEATVKTHCGNAKTIFREAHRRGLVDKNPFDHLLSGVTPSSDPVYVPPEVAERVIVACPHPQYQLVFALARYAGLRTMSETSLLCWSDIDFQACRMKVRSPKTERYQGHGERTVPIFPRLWTILKAAQEAAAPGEEHVVTVRSGSKAAEYLEQVVARLGLTPWPKFFQTLRSSCEIEWALLWPQYVVSKWIGHSITVSGRHYVQVVPDEIYARVVAQNAAQQPSVFVRNSGQAIESEKQKTPQLPEFADNCGVQKLEAEGAEPSSANEFPPDLSGLKKSGTNSGTLPAELVRAWPVLPAAARRAVLELVRKEVIHE